MRIIDSHCHPQFRQYDSDREIVIRRALDSGIGMICVGTDLESSRQAVVLAEKYEGVWASVGIHPNDESSKIFESDILRELAQNQNVVAIGETGLDYYRSPDENRKRIQQERFKQHIAIAQESQKPIIIHCRDAYSDIMEILVMNLETRLHGIVHSFTGSYDEAEKFIDLGFLIGLNGIITFSDSYQGLVDKLPLTRILCETDAPYLAPVPRRGQRNEPSFILHIVDRISEIKQVSTEEIIKVITANTINLFKLY